MCQRFGAAGCVWRSEVSSSIHPLDAFSFIYLFHRHELQLKQPPVSLCLLLLPAPLPPLHAAVVALLLSPISCKSKEPSQTSEAAGFKAKLPPERWSCAPSRRHQVFEPQQWWKNQPTKKHGMIDRSAPGRRRTVNGRGYSSVERHLVAESW